ncbi:MAG: hypothetical protein Q8J68_07130 [Methanolobus sp.]|nr:hypothetical protein [Methanolobus sp.]MDP2217037.1 hypothetical protein [Methanolobus sp.]
MDEEYLRKWFDPQSRTLKDLMALQHEANLMLDPGVALTGLNR